MTDNTSRNVAAGTVLLLPAATALDRALIVAVAFVLVAASAHLAGRVARQRAPDAAFVLVLSAAALCAGALWQTLLVLAFECGSALMLLIGLLVVNPAVLHGALGHRDGTDASAPPLFITLLLAPAVMLAAAAVVAVAGDAVAVLAQPAGLLVCGGLLLAATNALRRADDGREGPRAADPTGPNPNTANDDAST